MKSTPIAERFSRFLINLISNAVKFTETGGVITVDAQRVGENLQFQVSDTGIGIAADDLERIGQPFTQVQNDYTRQFDGTGLGLSLVKGLVALHGGEMTIESATGMGTTVTVRLPFAGGNMPVACGTGTFESGQRKESADETFRKSA